MANSIFNVLVATSDDIATVQAEILKGQALGNAKTGRPGAWEITRSISEYIAALANGSKSGKIQYSDGLVFAFGFMTFTGNPAGSDTFTIAGVQTTFVTTPPSGAQILIGSTLAATMNNIVAYFDAGGSSNNYAGIVTATLYDATSIKLFAAYPGPLGNLITCTKSCANMSVLTATFTTGSVSASGTPPGFLNMGL